MYGQPYLFFTFLSHERHICWMNTAQQTCCTKSETRRLTSLTPPFFFLSIVFSETRDQPKPGSFRSERVRGAELRPWVRGRKIRSVHKRLRWITECLEVHPGQQIGRNRISKHFSFLWLFRLFIPRKKLVKRWRRLNIL